MPWIIGNSILAEWFKSAWSAVSRRPFSFFAGVLIWSALSSVGSLGHYLESPWRILIGLFLPLILWSLAHASYTFFALGVVRGEDASVSEIFVGFRHFLPLLATYFLYAVIVCIGLLLSFESCLSFGF